MRLFPWLALLAALAASQLLSPESRSWAKGGGSQPPTSPALAQEVGTPLAVASRVASDSPLTRLAEAVSLEILRTAEGRPVEILPPEDRAGRPGLALDLLALVLERLKGRVALADTGARLRIVSVLSEAPGRLLFSARVNDEPGGRLLDVLSLSVTADPALLSLIPLPSGATPQGLDVIASLRTPPLESPALALAFLGDRHLVVLSPESVTLYRFDVDTLALLSRQPLSGQKEIVRQPGGILRRSGEDAFWALTNTRAEAHLFGVAGSGLVTRRRADALPWPGSTEGLRYRAGTNLIEGSLPGLGEGPFLGLDSLEGGAIVSPEGHLTWAGETLQSPRVGPTLTRPWPATLVTSTAAPPGEVDALLVIAREASGLRIVARIPVEGSVRALASQRRNRGARLAFAAENSTGIVHLFFIDLAPGGA